MSEGGELAHVKARAAELLDRVAAPPLVRSSGRVGDPVPVVDQLGDIEYWFVPVCVGSKIAGFFQLQRDLGLLRWSSFQRHPSSVEGAPEAAGWLDKDVIRSRAAQLTSAGDELGTPVLTYDSHPTRLVWSVPVKNAEGEERTVLVAGDYVYEARRGRS